MKRLRSSALLVALVAVVFAGCNNKTKDASENTVEVQGISLSKSSLQLMEGNSLSVTATVTPADAATNPIAWSCTGGVTLDTTSGETVKITAVSAGPATVTASSGGKTADLKVTVSKAMQVGDIVVQTFQNDGTTPKGWKHVSFKEISWLTKKEQENIISVIAYIDAKGNPIGIGLKDCGTAAWTIKDTDESVPETNKIRDMANTTTSMTASYYYTTRVDGEGNLAEMKKVDPKRLADDKIKTEYPAFGKARYYADDTDTRITNNPKLKNGWYIPSMRELQGIYDSKEQLAITAAQKNYENTTPITYSMWLLGMPEYLTSSNQFDKTSALYLKLTDTSDGRHGVNAGMSKTSNAQVLVVRKFTDPD
ncbi:MAG: Ig domain-containing protein [Treponema sp.]|nr:Ig domain-containing protein [Treponema sp.]